MQWVFLIGAILCEVSATLSLKAAVTGPRTWYFAVATGYLISFFFLTRALAEGLGIGVAYGIWAAAGVALTAIASAILFREPFNRVMALGIGFIMIGVALVEVGGGHA